MGARQRLPMGLVDVPMEGRGQASRGTGQASRGTGVLHRGAERIPEAIPGVPFEVVVTHVLGSENLSDVADLARLRAVSPAMKVAVAATRRKVEMLDE